jgi:hypothetical protein
MSALGPVAGDGGPPACMKRDRCTFCRKKLEIGAELTIRQRGVEGHRGPIPLDEVEVFCSDACELDRLTDIPDGPVRCPARLRPASGPIDFGRLVQEEIRNDPMLPSGLKSGSCGAPAACAFGRSRSSSFSRPGDLPTKSGTGRPAARPSPEAQSVFRRGLLQGS